MYAHYPYRSSVKLLLDRWKHTRRLLKLQRYSHSNQLAMNTTIVDSVQSVLSEAASRERYEVHIAPKYLIPDTNCYVDLLPSIRRLVDSTHFTIAVPLIGVYMYVFHDDF
jgi:hypothetical protein